MRKAAAKLCCLCLLATMGSADLVSAASILSAKRDIARLRYDLAESKLVDIARTLSGERRQEGLFLLAGLKSSVSESEIIYQEIIRIDSDSQWADASRVQLAKVQYALGNYGQAFEILETAEACERSEEACFFQGMSAAMSGSYPRARESLRRVRHGKYRPWAFLLLAEIDMNTRDTDAACRRYRAIARAAISPTAMYRYGECLEKQGSLRDARRVFHQVVDEFKNTPEALLATQKLERLRESPQQRAAEPEISSGEAPSTGYTIQFGAFHDRTNAIKMAAELKRDLPGIRIDSALLNNREIHRVRYGYFATQQAAQEKADQIAGKIDDVLSVLPLP